MVEFFSFLILAIIVGFFVLLCLAGLLIVLYLVFMVLAFVIQAIRNV